MRFTEEAGHSWPSWRTKLLILFTIIVLVTIAVAIPTASRGDRDDRVALTGTHLKQQFVAGDEVIVTAEVADDIFAAGGDVVFDGASAKDIHIAGGLVRILDTGVEDLIIAGGKIEIAAEISDDLITAGGRVRLDNEASVGGDAYLSGGWLDIQGKVAGDLSAVGGQLRIAGTVNGDVSFTGGRVRVARGAVIDGRLIYSGYEEPEISSDALIRGGVEHTVPSDIRPTLAESIAFAALAWAAIVAALVLLGIVLHLAFPDLVRRAVGDINERPGRSIGLGFAVLIATPIGIVMAMITGIGAAVGLFAGGLYVLLIVAGLTVIATWVGLFVTGRRRAWPEDITASGWVWRGALGFVVLAAIAVIPVLGFVLILVGLLLGLGAATVRIWTRLRMAESV